MQFHQEMRADRHVEGFRRVSNLQPGRDAADPAGIDLHDRAATLLHVFAKMPDRVKRFANRYRRRRRSRQAYVAVNVVGRQRLLDPGKVEVAQPLGAADRLVDGKALIAVGHDLIAIADRLAHRRKPREILRAVGLADLHLGAAKSLGLAP